MEELVCDSKKFELYPVEKKEPLKCVFTQTDLKMEGDIDLNKSGDEEAI